jgi:hypothetical protein
VLIAAYVKSNRTTRGTAEAICYEANCETAFVEEVASLKNVTEHVCSVFSPESKLAASFGGSILGS